MDDGRIAVIRDRTDDHHIEYLQPRSGVLIHHIDLTCW